MAIGGSRKSSSRLKKIRRRREQRRKRGIGRLLRVESLEDRRLLAIGPQVIGVQPNDGALLNDDDIRNVAPRDLTFQFNEGQVIDAATLGAVTITRAGLDGKFEVASARTDFNTGGAVVVKFEAKTPGPLGNEISIRFSKSNRGVSGAPAITVQGKTIFVDLNSNASGRTTAQALRDAINQHSDAGELVKASIAFGRGVTDIAAPQITYSPLDVGGATVASVTSNFNTGTNLEIAFTAVQAGPAANGLQIEVTKSNRIGAGDPLIEVSEDQRTIRVDLNSNPGNPTTALQLVEAFNSNAEASALAFASLRVGAQDKDIATPAINYSPLKLQGGGLDIPVTAGYLGLGDSDREVIFRFAETMPDDKYRIDIVGVGSAPLRNEGGFALGDTTDDGVDNGSDFSREFELDLSPQVLGVVPQPVTRTTSGLFQSASQIEVYFNDDDLDPVSATDPAFYQLIFTNDTVENTDDQVYRPVAVQYSPTVDRAILTFRSRLHQLGSGAGTFRLRIGTDEELAFAGNPMVPATVNLADPVVHTLQEGQAVADNPPYGPQNEVQWVALPGGVTNGSFELSLEGKNVQIPFNASAADIKQALDSWTTWDDGADRADVLVGDFNGDGNDDIAGRDNTGDWHVAKSNGIDAFTSAPWTTGGAGAGWTDVLVGDFTGDGNDDIAGLDNTGDWHVARSNGIDAFTSALWTTGGAGAGWTDVVVGNFNGDGYDDIGGRDNTGDWHVAKSNGIALFTTESWTTGGVGAGLSDVMVGDFNGDGNDDIAGRDDNGDWRVAESNGIAFLFTTASWTTGGAGAGWTDVMVGDFNGDGSDDITGRDNSGDWHVAKSNGSAFETAVWTTWDATAGWTDVMVGDFNGDGSDDITGRDNTGDWHVATKINGIDAFATAVWTTWDAFAGWTDVVVGDFNGDGNDDILGQDNTGEGHVAESNGIDAFLTDVDVDVTGDAGGPWVVEFQGVLGHTNVDPMTIDGTNLVIDPAWEVGSSFGTAHKLGGLTGSQVITSAISPQVHPLELPGSNDEPGHRSLLHRNTDGSVVESHLFGVTDSVNGLTTLFYNFRPDIVDQDGNPWPNRILEEEEQRHRAREVFDIYGGLLGVQFVESQTQGFTIATGDLRSAIPDSPTGAGDGITTATLGGVLESEGLLVMEDSENWYNGFGPADDPNQISWFEEAFRGVGRLLGLGDAYDLPSSTTMSDDTSLDFGAVPEPIYPGDHDVVHGQHLYRPEGSDIDLYRFQLAETGRFTATTVAERALDASLLDSVLALYREEGGRRELIARNDDYFSDDSHIELDLEPGVYYVGVSSTGNVDYDPAIEDSGFGGLTEGPYELRLTFQPDADSSILDLDNALNDEAGSTSRATALDGDGDGVPGGVFNSWFRVDATPIFVDKTAPAGGTGGITSPFRNIDDAFDEAQPGDVVRIVGNGGDDGDLSTPDDAKPYLVGFDSLSQPLADGATMEVPKGVTVMIDRGAVFKLRRARIGVGSSTATIDRSAGAMQVLGTPRLVDMAGQVVRDADNNILPGSVYFTSLNDESLGGDQNTSVETTPRAAEWGGLVFRDDLDRAAGRFDYEREGIFLNYVNQADIRYGGGSVIVDGRPRAIAPLHMTDTRPTITHNTITHGADAAISANPDSFEETIFHSPEYQYKDQDPAQPVFFTPDYSRIGPDVHGNRLTDNSINGMFVRTRTPSGGGLQELTVAGRWNDTDVVHVVAENLKIQGNPGGPLQEVEGPDVTLVTLQAQGTGTIPAGPHYYRMTFVDADGNETPASDRTNGVLVDVTDADTGETESVELSNLPLPPAGYEGRKLYRTTGKSASQFVLVKQWKAGDGDAADRTYLDEGTVVGGLLDNSTLGLQARVHGRLAVDPGTIVKLNGAGIEMSFGSQLIAEGLDGSEVVFTSIQDVRYGAGGTFQTSDEGSLAAGNWSGIYVGHMGSASIDHAVLAYGGGVSEDGAGNFTAFNALEIHQSEARITNSVIENSAGGIGGQATPNRGGHGPNASAVIFVRGARPIIVGNTIYDNTGPTVSIDVNSLNHKFVTDYGRSTGWVEAASHVVDNQGPLVRENRLTNNSINGMRVRGGTLTTEGVWDDTDIVHVVQDATIYVSEYHTFGGLRMRSSASESLVVKLFGQNAGFTATGRPLDISDRAGGMLHIVGQPGFPVTLTSLQDDTVGAGFQPDGSPQKDTNNDGTITSGVRPTLPTVPDVPSGTLIDDNVPVPIPGHFEFQPLPGGGGTIGSDGVTAQGNTQLFTNQSFIFSFENYIDVASNGAAVALGGTTVTTPPALTAPDEVRSAGNFAGPNGTINWEVRSYFQNGVPTLFNEVTFNSAQPFGNVQFINYLDEDVLAIASRDLLVPIGTPGQSDFEVFTIHTTERVGFSHGGFYAPGAELANATYDGWAADEYADLETAILGPGTTYTIPGNIDTTSLVPFVDPQLGPVYGPADITTAFSWTLDPDETNATVTSFLNLIPQDPSAEPNYAGDWGSIRLEEGVQDRNVDVATERETGSVIATGVNETSDDAQFLGFLAPNEKAGDDNRRLGFEIHGSLNRPGDVDVYSFDADVGTEVWLDIDRTSYSLDTVVELIDSDQNILALSDNSAAEAADPSLLIRDPLADEVNPLGKSMFDSQDLWSTNPRDAGMRVVLPGPADTTNTYHVRVRSSSDDLNIINGGLTSGVYQLQIRLQEADELPGTTVQMADIRYGTNGIELIGLPAHSPLTGEAAEALDAAGNDTNDTLDLTVPAAPTGFDDLGNLLNADRGALGVAGALSASNDVDWYRFEVRYDAIHNANTVDPMYAAAVFDIDYADGFAGANTNLSVFDDQGQLVLIGRDSNVAEDRPIGGSSATEDLSRGSLGALDPFIGTVELPARGFAPGVYYVAVSSNAVVPEEMQQFLSPTPINPLLRLEPINSINRIAEDHVDAQSPATANPPAVPILFGHSDQVTLLPPAGDVLSDGETFTITNQLGNWVTYEFDADGAPVTDGNVLVPFRYEDTSIEVGTAIYEAITENLPASPDLPDPNDPNPPVPTADAPLVFSTMNVTLGASGEVTLAEDVERRTLLNMVTTTDPTTNQLVRIPLVRTTTDQVEPTVRQHPAAGRSALDLMVSRPGAISYNLGDVTLFVSQDGMPDRTELLSVDPFTGQQEARIGAFGANVGDIAMDPRGAVAGGGLFAYSIPDNPLQQTDAATGNYWQIDPASNTPGNIGTGSTKVDDGIVTYVPDPAGKAIVANNKLGVGVQFNAMTFNNAETQALNVQGFAAGNRGDTTLDPVTGQISSAPNGIASPANTIFEFNPATGAALGGAAGNKLSGAGTDTAPRGTIDTSVDSFPESGASTTVTGVDATTIDTSGAVPITLFDIEDEDFFEVDPSDNTPVTRFVFDTGPEFYFDIDTLNATDPNVLRDKDRFTVTRIDGSVEQFEFDTGTVIVVNAVSGSALFDGDTIQITEDATNPRTITFAFDNDSNPGPATPITFTNTDNRQAIITSILNAINSVPSFGVTAVQLPGTNRITLLGESPLSATSINTLGTGVVLDGEPGTIVPSAVPIPVEENFTVDEIGQAIMTAVNDPAWGFDFEAGAVGNRLNFMGALDADFAGVTHPIFATVNPNNLLATGIAGTSSPSDFLVPFLANDNAADIAMRVHDAVAGAGFAVSQNGATVFLNPGVPQPTFICIPPGAPGIPDCPLRGGGFAPGGSITGMAFVGEQLYAVTDTGGLFRIANTLPNPNDPVPVPGRAFNPTPNPAALITGTENVGDYIEGSREALQAANEVVRTTQNGEVRSFEPIRFAGLVAGPLNTEDGRYENLLFGIDVTGRLFAFDTQGRPKAVFANSAPFADTGLVDANGLAFGTLDDSLWHVTDDRGTDPGHGVGQAFDGTRAGSTGDSSFYFGYEGAAVQSQFGAGSFAPATPAFTYDFPGGSHGSLVSNTFSLEGYSSAEKPALYYSYFLETEQADNTNDTTLDDDNAWMLDSFRVYISGDDGRWKLVSTNNSDRDPLNATDRDEFDPFLVQDVDTGEMVPEQPFRRSETFEDATNWRQAKLDLSEFAGQDNLRLRFDFSTAGGMSSGGRDVTMDLNTAGNELRAIPGAELRDGQMFTLTDVRTNPGTGLDERVVVAAFEFDMGPTIVAPTGAAIVEGATFSIDGKVYEFDSNNSVGATQSIPHVPVPYKVADTAGQIAASIQEVLLQPLASPPPTAITASLKLEANDTLESAVVSDLDGSTQVFRTPGEIGDNFNLTDAALDVDMIAIPLGAGDLVTIETDTTRVATVLDSYLRLFDANGKQVASNNDVDPGDPFSRDSRIDYTAPLRGTYYVGVSSAHYTDYDPNEAESGNAGLAPTDGLYEVIITVTDPTGPQRVGNRLNLPNADVISADSNLPASFVEGQIGVTPGLPNPFGATLPQIDVYPVNVDVGMTSLLVADAIRISMADYLGDGNVEAIKTRHEAVQVVSFGIGDAGPLGMSGPSDPNTAVANSGLFGDLFGGFGLSALADGQTAVGNPGALGMQNNQFRGLHVDDFIIGFASRGEMVVGSDTTVAATTQFVANTAQPADEIDVGAYQLEIRQATEYGLTDEMPAPTLQLYRGFDVDDRLAEGVALAVDGGHMFADGQTFAVADGQQTVTFEFDDLTINNGNGNGVTVDNTAILFDPGDSDVVMARRIRDAINNAAAQDSLDITAVSTDGVITGTGSASNRIDLFGDVTLTVGLVGNGPTGNLPVVESNDTLADYVATGIEADGRRGFHATGFIGDNPDLDEFGADVDLFRVELDAGQWITIDIDASELSSTLDSVVRVFDSAGAPVTVLDDQGVPQPVESDDNIAPGESTTVQNVISINRDSFLTFTAPAGGVYYIGVSAYDNNEYDPTLDPAADAKRRAGVPGRYEIDIMRPADTNGLSLVEHDGRGDSNLERDQGQVAIHSNRITHSSEFGIRVSPGARGVGTAPHPGPARNLSQINNSQLAPGVTITNNIIARNQQGGIEFSGDASIVGVQPAVVPFGRIINNTIVGMTTENGTPLGDVGIRVANNASPTVLNNVVSFVETGIDVDATSATTIMGGSLYHNNVTRTSGIGDGDFPIIANATDQLFVDRQNGNYYPAQDSLAIDSSVDSLEDRSEMTQLRLPMGIAASPVLAPVYDISGQLRVDDPSVAPPPGVGETVFGDRGAQDRSDFEGPGTRMIAPLDNGVNDLDPSLTLVSVFRASLSQFSIQLIDGDGQVGGSGIDDSTVNSTSVKVIQDNRVLIEREDYSFDYNTTSNVIRLTPLAGVWDQESNYVVEFSREDRFVVFGVSGDKLLDEDSFDVIDQSGAATTFEYDSGYVIGVPQTFALQIPLEGGGTGGVVDGDTITVDNTATTTNATLEMDSDGAVNLGNTRVAFTATSSQGEIADAIVAALADAGVGLNPVNADRGLVHLGVNGDQTLTETSNAITTLGVSVGVLDGQSFTIDDGTQVVTFQFSASGAGGSGVVNVPFSLSMTHEQVAESIVAAINGANVGLNATEHMGDGRVHVGGALNHVVDVAPATSLTLAGQPGVRPPWGLRIPTAGGAFTGLLTDGNTFVIDNGAGTSVTFELDNDGAWTAGNTVIPFDDTITTLQLADTMVSRIRNTNLGLSPSNFGNGIVVLGGDANFTLDVTGTTLTEVGVAGLPGANAIPFTPDDDFTAEETAQITGQIINAAGLSGISAEVAGELVYVSGASDVVGSTAIFSSSIKDLAGNPLRANQLSGATRFTIFVGAGMDYGDAPDPYPTRRADDGARHEIIDGFSLGQLVQVNADGQPTAGADGDDDEDGVTFDSPLIPGRTFNLTVSTSGIGTVQQFGVLDAWIDYNGDGDWDDSGEQFISNQILTTNNLTNGQIAFSLNAPVSAAAGDTYARFRLSTTGNLTPSGQTSAGEVEDYLVTISPNPWQNPANRFDVNASGGVSPIDVLILINTLNLDPAPADLDPDGNGRVDVLPPQKPTGRPFLDPTGDGQLSPLDVLSIIGEINRLNQQQGEGEYGGVTTVVAAANAGDALPDAVDLLGSPSIAATMPSVGRFDSAIALEPPKDRDSVADSRTQRRATDPRHSSNEVSVSGEPRGLSRQATSEANHLADILNHDESWLDFVEDVDLAMQGTDDRDAFFADLGV